MPGQVQYYIKMWVEMLKRKKKQSEKLREKRIMEPK